MQVVPSCGGCDSTALINSIPQLLLIGGIALTALTTIFKTNRKEKSNGKKG